MSIRLGIDPGQSTGICIADRTFNEPKYRFETLEWDELVPFLFLKIPSFRLDLVVCESFNLLPQKAASKSFSSFPEVEVIGLLRGLCHQFNVRMIELNAGTYKPFAEKNIQVPVGVKTDRHQKDAYRVLKYAERFSLGQVS